MDTNKIKSISRLASLLVALGFSLSFYISCKYISYVFVIIAIILSIFCIVKKVRRSLAIITTVVAVITILNIGNTKTKYLEDINKIQTSYITKVQKEDTIIELGEFEIIQKGIYMYSSMPVRVTNISKENKSFKINIRALDSEIDYVDTEDSLKEDCINTDVLKPNESKEYVCFKNIDPILFDSMNRAVFEVTNVSGILD